MLVAKYRWEEYQTGNTIFAYFKIWNKFNLPLALLPPHKTDQTQLTLPSCIAAFLKPPGFLWEANLNTPADITNRAQKYPSQKWLSSTHSCLSTLLYQKPWRAAKFTTPKEGTSTMSDTFILMQPHWLNGNLEASWPCHITAHMLWQGLDEQCIFKTLKSSKQALKSHRVVISCETGSSGDIATKITPKIIAWGIYGK